MMTLCRLGSGEGGSLKSQPPAVYISKKGILIAKKTSNKKAR